MKLEDAGIAPDTRDGVTLRASATARVGHASDTATTATLTALLRLADDKHLDLDITTLVTRTKTMHSAGGKALAILVISTAVGHPA